MGTLGASRRSRFPGWHGAEAARPPRARTLGRRLVATAAILVIVAFVAYMGYGVYSAEEVVHPPRKPLCATPARLGWDYEAINYDIAGDAVADAQADSDHCTAFGPSAGSDVVTADGIRVAGWYVPSARGDPPTAPTIVLVHGWATNKSDTLRYAAALHDTYNVVMFDQRNCGQSSGDTSTVGAREWQELVAILDWLLRTKGPARIGVLGDSGGGAATVQAIRRGAPIDAVVFESMHARFLNPIGERAKQRGFPGFPGNWAVYLGVWLRTGVNLAGAEPVDGMRALGSRPTLFIHGTNDTDDVPSDNVEVNVAAARAAGVPVELRWCEGGTHGQSPETCGDEYGAWLRTFFGRAFGVAAEAPTPPVSDVEQELVRA